MCRVVFVLAIVVLLSGSAQAQSPSEAQAAASSVDQQGEFDRAIENHWRFGFKASFNPWRTNRNLVKLVFPSASNIEVSGRDFEIGLVLGKHFGQEISVSYFNRSFASSSKLTVDRGATSIYFIGRVFEGPQYDVYSLSSASMRGFMVNHYAPIGPAIRNRIQFGLNYGAGLGQFRTGNISRRKVRQEFNFSLANPQLTQVETHETIEIKQFVEEEAGRYGGLALKLEAVGTILVAPGTKLRVGWGYNTLGFERFSATFVHLFGVRQKPALNR